MSTTRWRPMWTGLLVACACVLAVPAAALAEVRSGSATDPAGDSVYQQADMTAAEFAYDTQGSVTAKVTLALPPEPAFDASIGVVLGKSSGAECSRTMAALVTAPSGFVGATLEQQALNNPTMTQEGNVITVQLTDARIANQPWDCAIAASTDPDLGRFADETSPAPLGGAATPPPPPATKPPASKRKPSAKLKRAIRSCKRKHKSSKRSTKRKRARCISRARKKYGRVR